MADQSHSKPQVETSIVKIPILQITENLALSRRQLIIISVALTIFTFTLLSAVKVFTDYAHYAAIVDARLTERSFQQPAGIYAAPRRVIVGQHLTPEEFVERLQRASYLSGTETSEFAAGNFSLTEGEVKVRTNAFARTDNLPATVLVRFNKTSVVAIEDAETGKKLTTIALPAELLTADLNTKEQTRRATSFEEIPAVLVQALCAAEDRRFFTHFGIDVKAITRAALRNLRAGGVRQGGSTLTQQLIKNQFLTAQRTWQRKYTEALMAIVLEKRLTKKQIFALYSDQVYLGHSGLTGIYGFKQGARIFLGKEMKDLTVADAAFLTGLIKAPNRYAPHVRPAEAQARRNEVIDALLAAGEITAEQAAVSKQEQLALLPPPKLDGAAAPHFVDYVKRELGKQQFNPEFEARLRYETTLDLDLQQAAHQAVNTHLARLTKLVAKRKTAAPPEVALVALDAKSGEILALVGGRDYATSQLNRVTDARRQPGSVFKPIVYTAALLQGISPATTYLNAPHPIEFGYKAVYRPQNFGRSYSHQPVMLRESLVRSLNVVTVDAAMQVGLSNVAALAERMGLPRPQAYPSLALGAFEATPLEVARAYTVFANNGLRADPHGIRAVRLGTEIISSSNAVRAMVCSASTAYLVTDALADVVNRGTAACIRRLGYRGPVAGKTGTSRDAWFVGYTPKLVVAVWVGYDDNTDIKLTGGDAAAPIWAEFIKRALAVRPDLADKQFTRPAGLEVVEIDPTTGMLANEYCPQRQRLLVTTYLTPYACAEHHEPVFDEMEEVQVLPAVYEPQVIMPAHPLQRLPAGQTEPRD
jgi:penicillin-binding protein 1B